MELRRVEESVFKVLKILLLTMLAVLILFIVVLFFYIMARMVLIWIERSVV